MTRNRLARALTALLRAPHTDAACNPLPDQPDMVENDYYRFLNHPRD